MAETPYYYFAKIVKRNYYANISLTFLNIFSVLLRNVTDFKLFKMFFFYLLNEKGRHKRLFFCKNKRNT